MKLKHLCLCVAAFSTGVHAADKSPAPAPTSGQVLLLPQCPSDMGLKSAEASAGILAVLGIAVLQNIAVAAADTFVGLIEKRNADLSAVSSYEGFGWFYGPERMTASGAYNAAASANTVTGCVVVVRTGSLPRDDRFAAAIGPNGIAALARIGQTASNAVYTPDFYAELRLEKATGVLADGKPGAYGFRLKPRLVYFGRTAAKAGRDHKKALRLELAMTRYQLDKGELSGKAFYIAAFDFGQQSSGTLLSVDSQDPEKRLTMPAGPLSPYPIPADIKTGTLRLISADMVLPVTSMPDPVMLASQAKLIEAEDPSFLMKAITSAVTNNKTKIEGVATAAALKAVGAM